MKPLDCTKCIHCVVCEYANNSHKTLFQCLYFKPKSRFVELPCEVGQMVYEIEKNCLACIHYTDGGYSNFCECTLDDDKSMFECDFDKECIYSIIPKPFNYGMLESFGKTVFLSREEAEKALKEREL